MNHPSFDVSVVGSGLGGMCTGALLANAGYKVLVTERLPRIGGRFSSRKHKGYTLSTGGFAIELGGPVDAVLKETGAAPACREAPGVSFHIAGGFHEISGKGKLAKQIALVSDDEEETARVLEALGRGMQWMEPSASTSMRDWLLQYTRNEKILGLFQAFISGAALINADECPANEFFRLSRNAPQRPALFPEGGIALMEALAGVIRERGGAVWTGCPASRILVENHRAKGIVVRRERKEITIPSKAVVSNIGSRGTVDLAGEDQFDKGYLKQLGENDFPAMIYWIYFTSDAPLMRTSAPMVTVSDARMVNLLFDLTAVCPEYAPAGKHLYGAGASPFSSTSPIDFGRDKEICLADLREIFPDFDSRAEILMPQCYRGEWPGYRAWPGRGMPEKTPVVNLYNVGDGVLVPGLFGSSNCGESARIVAKDILRRVEPSGIA